jgi:hypothetical protein
VRFLIGFVRFWYDFIVGDDWTIALAVVAALALLLALGSRAATLWWLLPLVVVAALGASLRRAAR